MAYIPYNDIIEVCDDSGYNYELLMTYKTFAQYVKEDEHFDYKTAEANGWDTDEVPLVVDGYDFTCNLTYQGVWVMGKAENFVNSTWFDTLKAFVVVQKVVEDDRAWEMLVDD